MTDYSAILVGDFLSASSSPFGVIAAVIGEAFSSVKEMAATEMSLVSEEILKQTSLTAGMKDGQQKRIEEHTSGIHRVLSSLSSVVKLVLTIHFQVQQNFKEYSSVAKNMRGLKKKTFIFFQIYACDMSKLKEDKFNILDGLQHNCQRMR